MADDIWKPHATVAALCEDAGKYLLVKERIDGRIVFNQPAGHLEAGETLIDAVIRETLEETRYRFRPTALLGVYRYSRDPTAAATYLRFLFRGEIGERVAGALDPDIMAAEWMSYEQIIACRAAHRTPMVQQCIDDARAKSGYPLEVISREFA